MRASADVTEVPSPSPWVLRFAPAVATGAPVLDLACGSGRHARLFLAAGHPVAMVDRDLSRVADLAGCTGAKFIEADIEGAPWPMPGRRFGAVIVTNYLWRPIMPAIIEAVAPGGLLLYETFALGNEAFGRPRNPDHLLRPGELAETVRGRLDIHAYGQVTLGPPRPAVVQHIAARRAGPA